MRYRKYTRNRLNLRKAGASEDSIISTAPEREEAPSLSGGLEWPICSGGLMTKKDLAAWLLLKSFRLEVSVLISKKYSTSQQLITVSVLDAQVMAIRDDIETVLYNSYSSTN